MNKYIDAEKLIAEIKKRKDEWQALIDKNNAVNPTAVKEVICEDLNILDLITSLQQEQPSLRSNLDEAAEEYAYINWESDDYHEGASEGLPFDAIGHTAKCFKAGAEWMAEQEQPEVDLEKEIDNFFNGWDEESEYGSAVKPDCYSPSLDDCKELARHFYELGLNARKEE